MPLTDEDLNRAYARSVARPFIVLSAVSLVATLGGMTGILLTSSDHELRMQAVKFGLAGGAIGQAFIAFKLGWAWMFRGVAPSTDATAMGAAAADASERTQRKNHQRLGRILRREGGT